MNELLRIAQRTFGDMVKGVVDVKRGALAIGGELHADAEALLMSQGSAQEDLWGINLYPGKSSEDWIEFSALINIRPRQGNPSMEVTSVVIRDQIRKIVEAWIRIKPS